MADFSYFDQYSDMEIDFSKYIEKKSTDINYNFSNDQPVKTTIKNLFTHYNLIDTFKKNIDIIFNYTIKDTDTPEKISYDLYRTTDFWWVIFIFNNIQNPFLDWPLNQDHLNQLVDLLYQDERKYSKETYYQFIFDRNEQRRNIILPKGYAMNQIIWAYKEKLNV